MKVKKSLAFVLLLALAGCGSSEDTVADFIDSGNKYFEQGNYNKARLEYKNALQIDPRQAEPYYQLALIDEKNKNWKGMFANLNVVEQLNPNHHQALVKLGNIYTLSGQFDEATKRADKVLQQDPKNIEAKNLKASIALKQKNYGEAEKYISEVLAESPDNLEVLTLRVVMAKEQGDFDLALKYLDEAIAIHPDELSLKVIKLTLLENQQKYQQMIPLYETLIAEKPDNFDLITSYAKMLKVVLGEQQKAVDIFEKFVASHPDNTQAKMTLVSLIASEDKQAALSKLEEYIKTEPDNYEFRFAKIAMQKDRAAVKQELQSIMNDDPEGISGNKARVALAELVASEGDYEQAKTLAQKVLTAAPDDSGALLMMSKLNLRDGKLDEAITDLRTIIRNEPDSDTAHVLLARAYIQNGSPELAMDSYQKALDANPQNKTAALAVGQKLARDAEYDRAETVFMSALKDNESDTDLLRALTQVRIAKKDWAGSQQAIDSLKLDSGDSALSHLLSAQLYQGQEDYTLAIEEYKATLAINPEVTQALSGLFVCYRNLESFDGLVAYLDTFSEKNPQVLFARRILADMYASQSEWAKAYATMDVALKEHPTWIEGYGMLASFYQNQGENEKAITTYQRGIDANDGNVALTLQLASFYEQVGQYQNAIKNYETVLADNPSLDVAANNLASIYTDILGTPEDLQKALKLSEGFKDSTQPYFLDTYAWVNFKLGNVDKAEPLLRRVVTLAPDVPVFAYHLGALYQSQGNTADAEELLKTARTLATEQGDEQVLELLDKL